jgi:hypothetical protein
VKFAHQDNPEVVAFIDAGRLIKVYSHEDISLLAALQLAQSKWGGVQINGTDEYKRRCVELAVKNGIRIVNPEFQDFVKKLEYEREDGAKPQKTVTTPVLFSELKKQWTKLKEKLDKETLEIAEPRIAEAAKKQIETEALKIAAEKTAIYKEYLNAATERDAHMKKEPPEPLLLGYGKWQRDHEEWEAANKVLHSRVLTLWEKAGGDMSQKYTGYGRKEVDRRLTPEYAKEEAKRRYSNSAEWKDIKANIEAEARLEAEKNAPETKMVLDAVEREIRERAPEEKRNLKIAELDRKFENGMYSPGTMGFRLQVDHALEILELERERGTDEREALRLHPGAKAVLEKAEEYGRRERGLGR